MKSKKYMTWSLMMVQKWSGKTQNKKPVMGFLFSCLTISRTDRLKHLYQIVLDDAWTQVFLAR